MNKIFSLICLFQTIYRTIYCGTYVSGHDYIEQDDGSLKCELCGKISK